MKKYLDYAQHINAPEKVSKWIAARVELYIKSHPEDQGEIEHIIDYLASSDAPNNITAMTYLQAKKNTDKWTKTLIKRGENINEKPEDTEAVLDFEDGFKVVKLVGKAAFEREGTLMSNCVASYYGRSDTEVYSLRDKNNMPHCTMEKDQQVKGKGNGDIHPKYVHYVVKFLEYTGMTVGDSEMKHLGYANVEPMLDELHDTTKKILYADKYFPTSKKGTFLGLDSKPINHIGVLDYFPLVEESSNSLRVAFDIPALVSASIEWISSKSKSKGKVKAENIQSGGYSSTLAGGNSSTLAGGNSSTLAGGNSSKLAGGNSSKLAGGYYSTLAGGYSSTLAGGYSSTLAGGDYSTLAGGNSSTLAGGYSSTLAGGYSSKLAGGDYSKLAGGNYSKLAGGNYSKLAGGNSSIVVGDNNSKAKGGLGSLLVVAEREDKDPWSIVAFSAAIVDGETIKADTWYESKNGKFVEVLA